MTKSEMPRHSLRQFRGQRPAHLIRVLVCLFILLCAKRGTRASLGDGGVVTCSEPSVNIVVLTQSRVNSLVRLLQSLSKARYGCADIDLVFHIDFQDLAPEVSFEVSAVAEQFEWPHGRKYVFRKMSQRGLATSWFESTYTSSHEYVLLLEDDIELSINFYWFLLLLHQKGALSGENVTGLCLHPKDWAVKVAATCHHPGLSSRLYLSPEPCNWAPIWKQREWRRYLDWVFGMKARHELPLVAKDLSFKFNSYIEAKSDVQSSWVWRYNLDNSYTQVRYRFSACSKGLFRLKDSLKDSFFAINHKEAGSHFKKKVDLENSPSLLNEDWNAVERLLLQDAMLPAPFARDLLRPEDLKGRTSKHKMQLPVFFRNVVG